MLRGHRRAGIAAAETLLRCSARHVWHGLPADGRIDRACGRCWQHKLQSISIGEGTQGVSGAPRPHRVRPAYSSGRRRRPGTRAAIQDAAIHGSQTSRLRCHSTVFGRRGGDRSALPCQRSQPSRGSSSAVLPGLTLGLPAPARAS